VCLQDGAECTMADGAKHLKFSHAFVGTSQVAVETLASWKLEPQPAQVTSPAAGMSVSSIGFWQCGQRRCMKGNSSCVKGEFSRTKSRRLMNRNRRPHRVGATLQETAIRLGTASAEFLQKPRSRHLTETAP
jgi:hypothetical protein